MIASRTAKRHLSLLAAALLIVLAFGAWLRIPHLLTEQSGVVFGASYVDVHARMPAYRLLAVARRSSARPWRSTSRSRRVSCRSSGPIALYVVVAVGGSVYAGIIQRFVVGPNELAREAPQIRNHILATRRAWGIDSVERRES